MKRCLRAVLLLTTAANCERATPHPEPHQAMMPPGQVPMPHADGAMAAAMRATVDATYGDAGSSPPAPGR